MDNRNNEQKLIDKGYKNHCEIYTAIMLYQRPFSFVLIEMKAVASYKLNVC